MLHTPFLFPLSRAVVVLFLSAAVLLAGCAATLFDSGVEFEERGDLTNACNSYAGHLKVDPGHVEATLGLRRCGQNLVTELERRARDENGAGLREEALETLDSARRQVDTWKKVGVEVPLSVEMVALLRELTDERITELHGEIESATASSSFDVAWDLLAELEERSRGDARWNRLRQNLCYAEGKYLADRGDHLRAYYRFQDAGEHEDAAECRERCRNSARRDVTVKMAPSDPPLPNGLDRVFEVATRQKLQETYGDPDGLVRFLSEETAAETGVPHLILSLEVLQHDYQAVSPERVTAYSWSGEVEEIEEEGDEVRRVPTGVEEVEYEDYVGTVASTLMVRMQLEQTGGPVLEKMLDARQEVEVDYAVYDGDPKLLFKVHPREELEALDSADERAVDRRSAAAALAGGFLSALEERVGMRPDAERFDADQRKDAREEVLLQKCVMDLSGKIAGHLVAVQGLVVNSELRPKT